MIIVGAHYQLGVYRKFEKNVLKNHGYNYELINWTNNNLKKIQFINIWIQKCLSKNEKYIFVFLNYSHFSNPNTKIYLSQIAEKKTNSCFVCLSNR